MILTPEQIERLNTPGQSIGATTLTTPGDCLETLAAYAEIVERFAESGAWARWGGFKNEQPMCYFCKYRFVLETEFTGHYEHDPDCLYHAARQLRGKTDHEE